MSRTVSIVQDLLSYSNVGAEFVFGENFKDHFIAFAVMPIILYVSAIISVLFYFNIIPAFMKSKFFKPSLASLRFGPVEFVSFRYSPRSLTVTITGPNSVLVEEFVPVTAYPYTFAYKATFWIKIA